MPPDDSFSSQELAGVLTQDTSDESDSLSETIAAAVKTSEEDDSSAETSSEASDDGATDTSGDTEQDDSEETPDGADSEEKADAPDEDDGEKTDKPDDSVDESATEPTIEPPAQFSDADKELFRQQPREVQEFFTRRAQEMEADYTRKSQENADFRKTADAFNAALEPYSAYIASLNTTAPEAVRVLIGTEYALRMGSPEKKLQLLTHLAKTYGINLSDISEQSEDEAVAPEIAQVHQRLDGVERAIHGERMQAQTQLTQNAEAKVTVFTEEKDSAGNLLHPHFAELRVVMGSLIDANPELDVQTAYDNAVWSNPQLREAVLAKQRKEADEAAEQRRTEATEKVERERKGKVKQAKKAATSVKAGAEPPGPSADNAEVSLRDQIVKEFAAASS